MSWLSNLLPGLKRLFRLKPRRKTRETVGRLPDSEAQADDAWELTQPKEHTAYLETTPKTSSSRHGKEKSKRSRLSPLDDYASSNAADKQPRTNHKHVPSTAYGENEFRTCNYPPYISEMGETTSGRNLDESNTEISDNYINMFSDFSDVSRRQELPGDSILLPQEQVRPADQIDPTRERISERMPNGVSGGPGSTPMDQGRSPSVATSPTDVTADNGRGQTPALNRKLHKRAHNCETADEDLQRKAIYIRKLEEDLETIKINLASRDDSYRNVTLSLNQEVAKFNDLDRAHQRLCLDFEAMQQEFNNTNIILNQTGQALDRLKMEHDGLEQRKRRLEQQYKHDMATTREMARQDMLRVTGEMETMRRQHEDNVASIKRQAEERQKERDGEFTSILEQKDAAHDAEKEALTNVIASQNKRIASYSTGDYTAISDQAFSLRFQTLAQQISNLVHCVPRPESYTIDRALDPTSFLARNTQQGSRIWPKFVKSICWQVILHGFFQLPFGFGALGYQGEGYEVLFTIYQVHARPSPNDETVLILPNEKRTNVKRSALFEDILLDIKSSSYANQEKKFTKLFRSNVQALGQDLTKTLQRICHDRLDPRASSLISSMAYEFGVLALEMGSQRANILLERCSHGDVVKGGDFFKDDNASFGPSVQVDLMTQPCLRRIGDGREDIHIQKVIAKGDFVSIQAGY